MRYCLLNDCDNFKTVRPCCLDCPENNECMEKCGKRETTFCIGVLENDPNPVPETIPICNA